MKSSNGTVNDLSVPLSIEIVYVSNTVTTITEK